MNKTNTLIVLLVTTAIYIYLVWFAQLTGPGGSLLFSVLFLIVFIYLIVSLVKGKKK